MNEMPNYTWFYPETDYEDIPFEEPDRKHAPRRKRPDQLKMIPGARPKSRKQARRYCKA